MALHADPARWPDVKRLFERALEAGPAERAALLDRADPDLRPAVEALLAADAAAGADGTSGFLETDALDGFLDGLGVFRAEGAAPGTRIGPYRVVRPLGTGGMGEVYLAERADGLFDRAVALKRARGDLPPAAAARFETERQILAGLVHPGIARLYAAGVEPDGRPWLAMEPVEGAPLPAFAAGRPVAERVALVRQACAAVAHAHRRLVVHRDLKPSNVVATPDGRVVLLDFGIAHVLGAEEGRRMLTRAYAAPEQLRGDPASTASDVYGLGALLVETLTGERPQGPGDVRGLSGDLGAVAARALAEDPADRYPSADALDADLERWLEKRPVAAVPPTLAYRARRFVGRNRVPVAVAALAAAVLLVVGAGAALRVTAERDRARRAAADAEAVAEAQTALLTVLSPAFRADADSALALADVAEAAVAAAERAYAGRPAVLGRQLATFAAALYERGRPNRADTLYARALALRRPLGHAGDPVVHEALVGRGRVARDREAWDAARAFFAEALALERAHPDLADPAGTTALYHASVLPTHPERERALRAALDARLATPGADTSLATALAHRELGAYYRDKRLFREAFDEFLAAERIVRGRLGELHPTTNDLRSDLSFVAAGMGRYAEAERHARTALDAARRAGLGPLREAILRQAIGQALFYQYRADEAAAELRAAAAQFEAALGADAPQTLGALKSLAVVETKRGDDAAALAVTERVLVASVAAGMDATPGHLQMEARAAGLRFALGDRRAALADLLDAVDRAPPAGVSDFHRLEVLWVTGEALRASGRAAEALPLHREAVALAVRLFPPGHLTVRSHRLSLGRTLAALGRLGEARPHLEFARGHLDSYPAPDPLDDVDTEIDRLLGR